MQETFNLLLDVEWSNLEDWQYEKALDICKRDVLFHAVVETAAFVA